MYQLKVDKEDSLKSKLSCHIVIIKNNIDKKSQLGEGSEYEKDGYIRLGKSRQFKTEMEAIQIH